MGFSKLKQIADEKNWTFKNNYAYGEYDGYLFTIAEGKGFKSFFFPLPAIEEEQKKAVLNQLNNRKKELNLLKFHFDNSVLVLKLGENFKSATAEKIDELIRVVVDLIKLNSVVDKYSCVFCNNGDAHSKAYVDGICYRVHDECLNSASEKVMEASKKYESEGKHYLTGFVGALLGGLVCTIPWILVQFFVNIIASALAYLIGFGAFKGYTMFKGKLGPMTRWIVAFCTIFSVVAAQFGIIVIDLIKNNIPISSEVFSFLMDQPDFMSSFMKDMVIGLVMAILGIAPMFKNLRSNSKNIMPRIERNVNM